MSKPSGRRSASRAPFCAEWLLRVGFVSTTSIFSIGTAALAEPAPATDVELSELSVMGEGRGRTLNSDLYGAGGANGAVPGYVASRSTVGTKTDTPIVETAQSVSVIGRQQIEDQNALTINQALRYTPSVTTEQRGGAGSTRLEQFFIRGFAAPIFLDNMALPGNRDAFPTVDPYRLERVDIIKGPASVLYGQSGPGGIVNLVSKVPQFVRHGEIFVQGGGFSEVRSGFDIGGPIESDIPGLADQFAYRVIGLGWNGDGPAVTTKVERAFINPEHHVAALRRHLAHDHRQLSARSVLGLLRRLPGGRYGVSRATSAAASSGGCR